MVRNATASLAVALIVSLTPCALAADGTAPAPAPAAATAASAPAETRPPDQPVGVAPKNNDTQALDSSAIIEQGGALTPRGHLVIEPSFQYSHSSSNRVALVGYTIVPSITIGLIDIKTVESNTLIGALDLRYGITNRLEGEVKVPYVYRADSTSWDNQNVTTVFSADGDGLGDVEFGLRYQLNRSGGDAYYLLSVRAKSNTGKGPFDVPIDPNTNLEAKLPTGSGFWGIQPGLTVIVPSDPAVFFGSLSYMYNVPHGAAGYGWVDPGDIIEFNFGMGFALNEKTSFSVGYDHSIVGRVKIEGSYLQGTMVSQLGTLLIGYSYRENDRVSFSVSLGAGLTEAAPDVQLTIKVPYTL